MREEAEDDRANVGKAVEAVPLPVDNDDMRLIFVVVPALLVFCGNSMQGALGICP